MRLLGLSCLLSLLLAGCGTSTDPEQVCTLIGCDSGIEIVLEDPPEGPYRIEAFVYSEGPRYVYECVSQSGCTDPVFFAEFTPYRVFIDVVTDAGTERFEVVPTYQESQPNGPDCPPLCRTAVVRLPSDRLGA